jgi:hypothetical protein
MTQIRVALIAYLLFYLLRKKSKNEHLSFTNCISVIKTMLFQRISPFEWLTNPDPPSKLVQTASAVLEFVWQSNLFWTLMFKYI